MTNKTIIFSLFIILTKFGFSQTGSPAKFISKNGYGKTIIGQTLIQEVINENGQNYSLKSITYLYALANIGSGCLRIEHTKKYYRYKNLGITYIVSSRDTISGIIFYSPFSGQTYKGEIIGQTKITSLNIPQKDNKIEYSYPNEILALDKSKFSENAKHYITIEQIHYGFKNRRKTITEIRIGE